MTHHLSNLLLSLVFSLSARAAVSAKSTSDCCNALKTTFGSQIVCPNSSAYTSSVSSYFYLEQRSITPSCIIQPTNADDVSKAVKALAQCQNIEVAVRSGGHSPNVGFSNANEGITLDLRGLDSVDLSADGQTAMVGTGNQWGPVYEKLEAQGKTVVGARVYKVGIGGFLSGGGISFFSPRDGFGCDNVVNFQVVLASGAIINANSTSNPSLFRALKGGQNNFGIITRFDLQTKSTAKFWGGQVVTSEAADAAQLDAFTKFKQAPANPLVEIEQTWVFYGSAKEYLVVNDMYHLSDSANHSALDAFTSIQPQTVNTMRLSNASDFATEVEGGQPLNQYTVYATTTFPITSTNLKLIQSLWRTSTTALGAKIPNGVSAMTYQSIPPPPAASSPKNLFPFSSPAQTENLVLLLLSVYSSNPADYPYLQQSSKDFIASVEALLNQPGNGGVSQYKYLNYAASFQHPIAGYGDATVREMKSTAQMYDPKGFFQNVVKGGYKLSRENTRY